MRKEYSLIKNNVIIEMYNTDNVEKIKAQPEYDTACQIVEKEDWHLKGLNILRYQNGTLLSNEEAIKSGLIVLKDNEVLIGDTIIALDETQKVLNGAVVDKAVEELYIDGVIGDVEYDRAVLDNRIELYKSEIDPCFIEILQKYLSRVELPDDIKKDFDSLMLKKDEIKKNNPKTTNVGFNNLIEKKIQNLQEVVDENIR